MVEIWIHELASGKKTKADIGTETDMYVPRISWTMNPEVLSIRTPEPFAESHAGDSCECGNRRINDSIIREK